MIQGTFEVFEEVSGNNFGRKIAEAKNRLLYDGIEYILDFAYGRQSWHSGAIGYDGSLPGSGAWNPYRYVGLGYSADDNNNWLYANGYALTGHTTGGLDNMTGGTGISGSAVAAGANIAHFPSLSDTHMSSLYAGGVIPTDKNVGTGLFYKLANKITRSGRTVTIEATFTTCDDRANGDADTIPTGTKIRELVIALGIPTGSRNPSSVVGDRPGAIINKAVRYEVSGAKIIDNPITVGATNLSVRYTIGDII